MQQLLRERIVHHLGDLLLAHADLLSASEGLSVPNNVPNLGGCAIHPSAGKTNSAKFTPCIAPVRRRQAKPRWPSQDGGRHPRIPHSPPGSYHFPTRLLSNHKSLYEDHSFALYTLVLLGTTISVSLSRAPLIPPPRISAPAFLFVSGRSQAYTPARWERFSLPLAKKVAKTVR